LLGVALHRCQTPQVVSGNRCIWVVRTQGTLLNRPDIFVDQFRLAEAPLFRRVESQVIFYAQCVRVLRSKDSPWT
jgi:hypothetical protein